MNNNLGKIRKAPRDMTVGKFMSKYEHSLVANWLVEDAPEEGFLWGTTPDEIMVVNRQNPEMVFTVTDREGKHRVERGLKVVDRVGYFLIMVLKEK